MFTFLKLIRLLHTPAFIHKRQWQALGNYHLQKRNSQHNTRRAVAHNRVLQPHATNLLITLLWRKLIKSSRGHQDRNSISVYSATVWWSLPDLQ